MRTLVSGLAAAMLAAGPALAEPKPDAPAPVATGTASGTAAQDKKYCALHSFTGSRLPKKICKTRARWIGEDGFDPLAQK